MQSCNVAGLFEVNNYICTYLIHWHEHSNSKKMSLSTGENCSHVVEKATGLQRQPGAPERFEGDLSSDWLHGSRQRSWYQSPLHWRWWHEVKPWIQWNTLQHCTVFCPVVLFAEMWQWINLQGHRSFIDFQSVNTHDCQVVVCSHHFKPVPCFLDCIIYHLNQTLSFSEVWCLCKC